MTDRRFIAVLSAALVVVAACAGPSAASVSSAGAAKPGPSAADSSPVAGGSIGPADCVVGVSWYDLRGERWAKWDEPALHAAVVSAGATYMKADATSSAAQQTSDIESLISRGARVLIVVAQDGTAVKPAVADAIKRGVQVIAYDRLIDDPKTLYVSFDNVEVGRMQARAVLAAKPAGNYAFIKGDRGDANSDFLRAGQEEIIGPALKSGVITNVGETYTDNWDPTAARTAIAQLLTDSGGKVDAVLAENDGLADGVINALADHGLAGKVAVSGEDGDGRGLNNVALGTQLVDVWKDERMLAKAAGDAAVQLCDGVAVDKVGGVSPFATPAGITLSSIQLKPDPITSAGLQRVVDAGWITVADLCQGVVPGSQPICP